MMDRWKVGILVFIAFYFLACRIFTHFPFELKQEASNSCYVFLTIIPFFQYSNIPCGWNKASIN